MTGPLSLFSLSELRRKSTKKEGDAPKRAPMDSTMLNITKLSAVEAPLSFIREGFQKWTPAQANMVFQRCRYARNRSEMRGKSHIDALARQMSDGTWLPRSGIDFARLPDGTLTLVNGHHRMLAQVQSGRDIEWSVVIHDCADQDDIANLFWRFDTVVRLRSTNNILDGVNAAASLGLSKLGVTALASAVTFIDNGMRPTMGAHQRTYTPAEKLTLMSQWGAEARAYEVAITAAKRNARRKLYGVQVMAVGLVTMRAAPESAEKFWRGIAEDDGLARHDPRKTLLDYLRDTHLAGSGYTATSVAVARAWSAWEAGRDLTMVRIGKTPVRIVGSDMVVAP